MRANWKIQTDFKSSMSCSVSRAWDFYFSCITNKWSHYFQSYMKKTENWRSAKYWPETSRNFDEDCDCKDLCTCRTEQSNTNSPLIFRNGFNKTNADYEFFWEPVYRLESGTENWFIILTSWELSNLNLFMMKLLLTHLLYMYKEWTIKWLLLMQ